jgi:hypothetical protein
MKHGSIYLLVSPESLDYVRYVGQTVQKLGSRLTCHIQESKRWDTRPTAVWIKDLSFKNLKPEICLIKEITTPKEIFQATIDEEETKYIRYFRNIFPDLLNLQDGGGASGGGWKLTEETRRRIGKAGLGRHPSPETIERISRTQKELQNRPEVKALRMGARNASFGKSPWNKGKCHTEETKREIGKATSGEKNSNARLTWQDVLEIRKKYVPWQYTQKQLAKEYGVSCSQIGRVVHDREWKSNEHEN